MNSALLPLLDSLVACESITPADAGCQDILRAFLSEIGFVCQTLDNPPVSNLFARYGTTGPLLLFAGHTDVVPPGDVHAWKTSPFRLHETGGMLFGRGVADMKGSLVCMLLAAKAFVERHPKPAGSMGFLITSGEEGDDFLHGTPYVMEQLKAQGIHPDYCIVGEPSSSERIADMIRIGRRGSLSATLVFEGIQGHVAYPHLAQNPIHEALGALTDLAATVWDNGNQHFPPTSLQITRMHAGGISGNVIPGTLEVAMNFRYSTEQSAQSLKEATEACFARHGVQPRITWRLNGEPFLTSTGRLLDATCAAIKTHCGYLPECSTAGGTSDGRFIAPYGVEVIELGPVNATIHQVNECVGRSELEMLTTLYTSIAENLVANP